MDTLPARLEWILNHRKAPNGDTWTARGLSSAAGLSPSYVGMLRRQAVKSPGVDVLRAIATAAGVSVAVPRGTLARLSAAQHVPPWALRLRRQTARAVPRAA